MFCEQCGTELSSDAKYCESCGARVGPATKAKEAVVARNATMAEPALLAASPEPKSRFRSSVYFLLALLIAGTFVLAMAGLIVRNVRKSSETAPSSKTPGSPPSQTGGASPPQPPSAHPAVAMLEALRKRDLLAALEHTEGYQNAIASIQQANPQVLWQERINACRAWFKQRLESGAGIAGYSGSAECGFFDPATSFLGLRKIPILPQETNIQLLETREIPFPQPTEVAFVQVEYLNAQTAPLTEQTKDQVLKTVVLSCGVSSARAVTECTQVSHTFWSPLPFRVTGFGALGNFGYGLSLSGYAIGGRPPYTFQIEANGKPLEQVFPVSLYTCDSPVALRPGFRVPPACDQGSFGIFLDLQQWPQNAPWPVRFRLTVKDSSNPPETVSGSFLLQSPQGP